MSVTFGFYNSINHDRMYDASQFSEMFDGIISDGVYELVKNDDGTTTKKFMVEATGTGFQVTVDNGRAWFYHTWTKNDAKIVINLPAPPTLVNRYRYDAIVIDINANTEVRANAITYVSGEESASETPPKPALENSGLHHQVPLAYVLRVGREETILQSNITITTGTQECPFVTGVVDFVDISNHVKQWEAALREWSNAKSSEFTAWMQYQMSAYETWRTGQETSFETWRSQRERIFTTWMDDEQTEFEEWVEHLRVILDDNAAGHLQNEIEALANRITPIKNGGTGNDHGHIQSGYVTSRYTDAVMGEYATAEGTNTVASGKSAHAEGSGGYTSEFRDEGYTCDNFIPDNSITNNGGNWERTDAGSVDNTWNSGSQTQIYTDVSRIKSVWVACVLKNETTNEILFKQVGCIGPTSKNSNKYIGQIAQDSSLEYVDFYSHYGSSSYGGYRRSRDFGYLKPTISFGNDNDAYTFIDGYNLELPNIVGYIDLPPTDYDDNDGWASLDTRLVLVDQSKQYTSIFDKTGPHNPAGDWEVKNGWINDSKYGVMMGELWWSPSDPIDDSTVSGLSFAFGDKANYYDIIDIDFSFAKVNGVRMANDGSCRLHYKNLNPDGKTFRIYFTDSTKTYDDYKQEALNAYNNSEIALRGYTYVCLSTNNTASQSVPSDKTIYLRRYGYDHIGGKQSGDKFTMSYYYSMSTSDNVDYPISWTPAGTYVIANGAPTRAIGNYSHAEGLHTKAYGIASHAEGSVDANEIDYNDDSNSPGAYGRYSHVEGLNCDARGDESHAEGYGSKVLALMYGGHAEGEGCICGDGTTSSSGAHAEGIETESISYGSHSEGTRTKSYGRASHAEGFITQALSNYSHSEGYSTKAWNDSSDSTEIGEGAHAEGFMSEAAGRGAHAEGENSYALARSTHAGAGGIASRACQFVHGVFGFGGVMESITPKTNGDIDGSRYGDYVSVLGKTINKGDPTLAGGAWTYSSASVTTAINFDIQLVWVDDSISSYNDQYENRTWLIIIASTHGTTRTIRTYTVQSYRTNSNTKVDLEMVKISPVDDETAGFTLNKVATKSAKGYITVKGATSSSPVSMRMQVIRVM